MWGVCILTPAWNAWISLLVNSKPPTVSFAPVSCGWRLDVQACAAVLLPAAEDTWDRRGASWDQPPCLLRCSYGRRHPGCQSSGWAARPGVHTTGQCMFKTPVIASTYGDAAAESCHRGLFSLLFKSCQSADFYFLLERYLTFIKLQQHFWIFYIWSKPHREAHTHIDEAT